MNDKEITTLMNKCRRIDAKTEIEEFTSYPVPKEDMKATLDEYISNTLCDPDIQNIKRKYGNEQMKKAWANALLRSAGWQDFASRAPEVVVMCIVDGIKYIPSVSGSEVSLTETEDTVTIHDIATQLPDDADVVYTLDGKELKLTSVHAPDTENIILWFE